MLEYFINGIAHATPQGYVGVTLILVYFAVMMSAVIYRIKKGDHMRH